MFKTYLEQVYLEGYISDKIEKLAQGSDQDLKELLDKFNKYRNQHKLDINNFNTLEDLVSKLNSIESGGTQTQSQVKAEAKDNAIKLIENEDFLAVIPLRKDASCAYGKGSKWCVSAQTRNAWKDYTHSIFCFVTDYSLPDTDPAYKHALQFRAEDGVFSNAWNALDRNTNKVPDNLKEIFPEIQTYIQQHAVELETKILDNAHQKLDAEDFDEAIEEADIWGSMAAQYDTQKGKWNQVREAMNLPSFEALGKHIVDNDIHDQPFSGMEGIAILSKNKAILDNSDFAGVGEYDNLIYSEFYGGTRLKNWLIYAKPYMKDNSLIKEIEYSYDMSGIYSDKYEIDLTKALTTEFIENSVVVESSEKFTKNQTLATFELFTKYLNDFAPAYTMNIQGDLNQEEFYITTEEEFKEKIVPKVKEINDFHFSLACTLK